MNKATPPGPGDVVTNRARGDMLHAAAAVHVRHFAPFVSDEPPSRGGEDRGPSPLELVLRPRCPTTR